MPPVQKQEEALSHGSSHRCHSSIIGYVVSARHDYGQLCFTLRTRQSEADVNCLVRKALADKIGLVHKQAHNLDKAWKNSRIMVEGLFYYNARGYVEHIDVKGIQRIEPKEICFDDIYDENFTNGLPVGEYQERLREGRLDD